jgi:hypothetical protein
MVKPSYDEKDVIDNGRLAVEINVQESGKGKNPHLVFIKACHSAEGDPNAKPNPLPPVASEMARITNNYVLGVVGANSPSNTDQTHPVTHPGPFELPLPGQNTQVVLFGPDGKECARFNQPLNFKEVQKWIKEHPQKAPEQRASVTQN